MCEPVISWLGWKSLSLFFSYASTLSFHTNTLQMVEKSPGISVAEAVRADLYLPFSSLCLVRSFCCWFGGASTKQVLATETRQGRGYQTHVLENPQMWKMCKIKPADYLAMLPCWKQVLKLENCYNSTTKSKSKWSLTCSSVWKSMENICVFRIGSREW